MCGIWTLVNLNKSELNISKYLSDFWNLKKRGPDNSCFETFPQAWVGFHRLAIMDTSFQSNQPFVFQQRNRTIVFLCNGEIYNFKELIEKYNLDIEGNSDCMTIPKLYLKFTQQDKFNEWLKLFNNEIKGEYAFVLLEFDQIKSLRKVITGRDQIGIRPMYYHPLKKDSKNLLFTSEIKGGKNFEGELKEFPPGNIYTYQMSDFDHPHLSRYSFKWVYDVKQIKMDENYYLDKIRNSVIDSVRRRLDADRPLAFLLSGGVDSSLVAAIGAKILGYPIKTFCCGMNQGTDMKYAKMVADHIGSNHTEIFFTKEEALNSLSDIIYTTETWDTTTIRASSGQYMVCKYIGTKTDCKVVLVGEGPDEVCSSYLFNWYAPNSEELHKTALDYVEKIHMFDSRRADRCISYWSLEGRVPLLDPQVIEAYWELPSEWRHPEYKGIEKWWLRKAFDGMDLLPDEVLWRKKEAFSDGVSSKEESWFEMIQKYVEDKIDDEELKKSKLYDGPKTKEALWFRKEFIKHFGEKRKNILPHYWLPKWDSQGNEVKEYMDPSARVLKVY